MPDAPIRVAPMCDEQLDRAVAVMARAFRDDPLFVSAFPDPDARARAVPPIAAWNFRHGLLFGEILVAGDPPVGVSIAYHVEAPVYSEERVAASLGDLRERLGADGWAGYARVDAPWHAADARLAAALPGPHWYLDMVAVASEHQGGGIGTALITAVHARADAEGLPTGLLTFQPRNRPLYERLGYALVGAGPDPASGLNFWCYRRPPR